MTNYVVIKNNPEKANRGGRGNTYGICACSFSDGVLEVKKCVNGISDDLIFLKLLTDKLNRNDVDPIHLENIVEDELYAVR